MLPRHGTSAVGVDVIFYIRNPARYYRRSSCAILSFVQVACVCVFFRLFLIRFVPVCVFVSLCLGGGSGFPRRSNPSRDTGSKRLRNPDDVPEGSSAAPQRRTKHTASKQKEPVMGMDEMPQAEFVIRRKLNPYVNPRANLRGNDLFWTK